MGRKTNFQITAADKPVIEALPNSVRHIFEAFAIGHSYEDISTSFNVKLGTVKSRLHRARAKVLAARQQAAE